MFLLQGLLVSLELELAKGELQRGGFKKCLQGVQGGLEGEGLKEVKGGELPHIPKPPLTPLLRKVSAPQVPP